MSLNDSQAHYSETKKQFSSTLALKNATPYPVLMTEQYMSLFQKTLAANDIQKQKMTEK